MIPGMSNIKNSLVTVVHVKVNTIKCNHKRTDLSGFICIRLKGPVNEVSIVVNVKVATFASRYSSMDTFLVECELILFDRIRRIESIAMEVLSPFSELVFDL